MKKCAKLSTALKSAFKSICAAEKTGLSDDADVISSRVAANAYLYRRYISEIQKDMKKLGALPSDRGMPYVFSALWSGFKKRGFILDKASVEKALSGYDCSSFELDMLKVVIDAAALIETGLVCANALENKSFSPNRLQNALLMLKKAEITDFSPIYRCLSEAERLLAENEEHYCDMTDATKALYRGALRRCAEKRGITEKEAVIRARDKARTDGCCIGKVLGIEGKRRTVSYCVLCFAVFAGLFSLSAVLCPPWSLPLLLFPLISVSLKAGDFCFSMLLRGHICPAISPDALPEGKLTLTVITTLLGENAKSFSALERLYLTNAGNGLFYGLLADLPQAGSEDAVEDGTLIADAANRIKTLNLKYGEKFCLFVRKRSRGEGGSWVGKERKRGAIEELVRYLCGKSNAFLAFEGPDVKGVRFLLTLDADTGVPPEGVAQLTGMMLHPINTPVLRDGRVCCGYGILQPGVQSALESRYVTRFAAMLAGAGGIDVYESAAFNRQQSIFGEGIFCGKGILDIQAYSEALSGVLPKGRVLSHDMPEGNILRTRYVSDLCFTDNVPKSVLSYYKRLHRWIRGDVQNLSLVFRYKQGVRGSLRIIQNVLRHALPVFSLLALTFAGFLRGRGRLLLCFFALTDIFSPLFFTLISRPAALRFRRRRFFSSVQSGLLQSVSVSFYESCALCHKSFVTLDAAFKAAVRLASGKKLLLWVTAAQAESGAAEGLFAFIYALFPSALVGSLFFFLSGLWVTRLLGLLWFLFPLYACFLSRRTSKKAPLSASDRKLLREKALPMWKFFADNVNVKTAFLPPDNVQISPVESTAFRTSPTNIGLYLLSAAAAEDFGFISAAEAEKRISCAFESLDAMKRWHGHFYNWYALPSLEVIGNGYVSTVDSGNLCVCLLALSRALYGSGRTELAKRAERFFSEADFKALYNGERRLFSLGFDGTRGVLSDICYDLYMSEARSTSYFALAFGQVPLKHWRALQRPLVGSCGYIGMASWAGTAFEYFMPQLFLPLYRDSFVYESLRFALNEQKRHCKGKLWGCSESAFYCFDADMNYQYKAHGVQQLALTRYKEEETVFSPYSVYLTLCIAPHGALKTLLAYENEVKGGKYGLYEAVDFTGGGVVQSYMAHHVGMSLIACANACFDGVFIKRFMDHPRTAAFYELLQEKIPVNAAIFSAEKQLQARRAGNLRYSFSERLTEYNPAEPVLHVSGKGANTIVADSCGHVRFSHGDMSLNEVHFDAFSAARSLFVLFCGGKSVYSPAPGVNGGKFSFESASGYAAHICSSSDFSGRVKYYTDGTGCFVTETKSDGGKSFSLVFSFDVQLAPDREFFAHPSFHRLLVSAEYDKTSNAIIYAKNSRDGKDCVYMAVGLSDDRLSFSFETNKDGYKAFSLYSPADVIKESYTDATGVCVTPFCLVKTPPVAGGETRLIVSVGHGRQEALERLFASRRMHASPVGDSVFGERENSLLSGLFYGKRRFAKTLLATEGKLWGLGLSGDYPIIAVLAREIWGRDILFYIRVFKRLAALNVRTELVFLICEEDRYSAPNTAWVRRLVRAEKCESFIGKRGGIFFADGHDADTVAMLRDVAACFTESFDTPFGEKGDRRFSKPLPEIVRTHAYADENGGERVCGGCYGDGCFTVDKDSAPKLPFSYVLSGRGFGSVVTHASLGYSFCENSALGRIAPFSGDIYGGTDTGEALYLFCEGRVFDLAACSHSARFGNGKAEYRGFVCGKFYTLSVFVCEKLPLKVFRLSFDGDFEGDAALAVQPLMGSGAFPSAVAARVPLCFREGVAEGFRCPLSPFFGDYVGFVACLGGGSTFFSRERLLNGGKDNGLEDVFALRRTGRDSVFMLGAAPSGKAAERVLSLFAKRGAAFEEDSAKRFAAELLPPVKLCCSSAADVAMFGVFAPYQAAACRFFARAAFYQSSGAYGFRDQLQDCLWLVYTLPQTVRTHLLRCAARQYEDGSVQHWWHPCSKGRLIYGVKTKCSDDFLWLPLAVAEYVEKTGDVSVLKAQMAYLSSPPLGRENERYEAAEKTPYKESLYQHCKRAVSHGKNYGAHGIPLMGSCDWNDAFSNLGDGAESVFDAFLYVIVLRRFANVALLFGDEAFAGWCRNEAVSLLESASRCFDGDRFIRAYTGGGAPLGAAGRTSCEIDILSQSFAVFAGADKQKCKLAVKTAYDALYDREYKILKLFSPPFGAETEYAGYINAYAKGVRENGGQYTHAALWFAAAMALCGMHKEALELFSALNPLRRAGDKLLYSSYKGEPYAISADIYTARGQYGRAGWSFYTGSAAWYCKLFFEVFMGVRLTAESVDLKPLFEYDAVIPFRGNLRIRAKKGAAAEIDGKPLTLPLRLDGKDHDIVVPVLK